MLTLQGAGQQFIVSHLLTSKFGKYKLLFLKRSSIKPLHKTYFIQSLFSIAMVTRASIVFNKRLHCLLFMQTVMFV